MTFSPPPVQSGEFSELVAFVSEASDFLVNAIALLLDLGTDLDAEIIAGARDAQSAVQQRSASLIDAIQTGDFAPALRAHGLANGSPEWKFKVGVYRAARRRFNVRTERVESGQRRGVLQRLRWMRHPLKAINVILKSVAAAIPGIGGALAELKDSTEAAIDDYTDET